uniref:Uncharacterized protein n=1 Tax=Zea mays TaxID=4577 RepID=A0A804P1R3_MAIZE
MRWKTSRTCLSSGSSPSFMAEQAAASWAAASRTSASRSPVSGTGAASMASASLCAHFSSAWISLSRPHELRRSLRFPSSARRSWSARSGGAQGNAARGGAAGRWCAWSAAARSGQGTAATSAQAARWSRQPMAYAGAARLQEASLARGAARPAPMACSWRAADQVRDTLHESERKCAEGDEDDDEEEEARDGDARARPKERLRWDARIEASPPAGPVAAAAAASSMRSTERSESAFRARRSWPSWIWPSAGASSADAAMPARRSQRRAWSTPSRAALQTSRALTARSPNSATSLSPAGGVAPARRRRASATATRNSSWQSRNASSRRRIHAMDMNSSSPAAPGPLRSARCAATWAWNSSSSGSTPGGGIAAAADADAGASRRRERRVRPKEENGEEPWRSVAGMVSGGGGRIKARILERERPAVGAGSRGFGSVGPRAHGGSAAAQAQLNWRRRFSGEIAWGLRRRWWWWMSEW